MRDPHDGSVSRRTYNFDTRWRRCRVRHRAIIARDVVLRRPLREQRVHVDGSKTFIRVHLTPSAVTLGPTPSMPYSEPLTIASGCAVVALAKSEKNASI